MIKHTTQEITDWAPSFSFLEIATQKEYFFCFIWILKVSLRLTLIQRGGLCPLRSFTLVIPSSYLFVPLQGIAPENSWLEGHVFEELQNYMQNKNEGNGNKIISDLNCTMDKIDRDGENKTQRLYRCCSNYALSKLIVDNGLEDLWRRENPDSPEFTCYDRSFAKDPGYTGSILISILIKNC